MQSMRPMARIPLSPRHHACARILLAKRIPISSPLSITPAPRPYHSTHHPEPPPFPPTQQAILSAAYTHVPAHGFTAQSLTLGAETAGYPAVSLQILPDPIFALIKYHLATQRLSLSSLVQSPNTPNPASTSTSSSSNTPKIRSLTLSRLHANTPILPHLPTALAHMSLLSNLPASLSELARLADEILHLAGDTAVDPSWYARRASLSAVYAATELYMTADASERFRDTERFLDDRLAEAEGLGRVVGNGGGYVGFWAGRGVDLVRSLGVRV